LTQGRVMSVEQSTDHAPISPNARIASELVSPAAGETAASNASNRPDRVAFMGNLRIGAILVTSASGWS